MLQGLHDKSHPSAYLTMTASTHQGPLNGAGHVCRARNLIGREPWPEEKHKNSKFAVAATYWAPANGVGKPIYICIFMHEIVKNATIWWFL